MQLDLRERRDVTILVLEGRLVEGPGDRQLQEATEVLLESRRLRVVVDLSSVTTIDSRGLGELVTSEQRIREAGGRLKLIHPTDRVVRVLDIAQVLPLFEVFETEEDAVRSFAIDRAAPTTNSHLA